MLGCEEEEGAVDYVAILGRGGDDIAESNLRDYKFILAEYGEADVKSAGTALLKCAWGEVGGVAEVEGCVVLFVGGGKRVWF